MKRRIVSALLAIVLVVSFICVPANAARYPEIYIKSLSTDTIFEGESGLLVFDIYPAYRYEAYVVDIYKADGTYLGSALDVYENDGTADSIELALAVDTDALDMGVGSYYVEYSMAYLDGETWVDIPTVKTFNLKVVKDTCKSHDYFLSNHWQVPTCYESGMAQYECSKCGYKTFKYLPEAHQYEDYTVLVSPTPEYDGLIQFDCMKCGQTVQQEYSREHAVHIITEPKTAYAKNGAVVSTSVKAGGDGLRYQWYTRDADADKYTKSSVTGSTYSCKMTEKSRDRRVLCIITDEYGNQVQTKTVLLRMAATITEEPKNTYVKSGAVAKVSVGAEGEGLTYQWYIKNAGQTKYSKSSVTGSTYSCKMDAKSKDRLVYCVVTDQAGNSVKSKTVILREKVSITTEPSNTYVKAGETAKITVKASGDGLKYQWYIKNEGGTKYSKSSVTSATYSCKVTDASKNRLIYCVVTDAYGNQVKSKTVILREAASITQQPQNATAAEGATVKVNVKAAGDGLKYQWYIKNANGSKFSKSSVTGATYSCKMNDASNGRQVYCVVTDAYGKTVTSKTITLTMK